MARCGRAAAPQAQAVYPVAGLDLPVRLVVDRWGVPHIYAQDAATRFAAGINGYLDWLGAHPGALPAEFQKLNYKPARWRPEDVVRIRARALSRNLTSEIDRSRVACAADVQADQVRTRLEAGRQTALPAGYDPCALPSDVLRTFTLATGKVEFKNGRLVSVPAEEETSAEGSNNWAVAPGRSTTGRPILANDPHRENPAPSQRYLAQLSAPGLNVIGAGEPSAPGISIGHNDAAGFGLTISAVDQEDLYVYQLDPANPNRYRYGDGWEDIKTSTEQVPVSGGQPTKVDAEHHLAYAVRAAWLEPGMSPYYGSLKYLRAQGFSDYEKALDNWGAPSLNHVYADTKGDIGWVVGRLAPKRVGYDGLLPVPGDGRYEWSGFLKGSELPRAKNPRQGFIATANEYNLSPDYPVKEKKLGFEWANPARYQRIVEVLSAKPKTSPQDSMTLQNDELSIPARRLVKLLEPLSSTDPAISAALGLLRGWDAVERSDSPQAALFEVWLLRHLGPYFVHSVLPAAAAAKIPVPDHVVLVDAMENPDKWFGPGGAAVRDKLLPRSLGTAFGDTTQFLGANPAEWEWGNLQHTWFRHPLGSIVDGLDVGPLAGPGGWYTVNNSFFYPNDFEQRIGPPLRMVLDVGNWDASQVVNAPGQSGDPASPHYRDQAENWRTGQYFPLLYSRAAVEANAEQHILLVPSG